LPAQYAQLRQVLNYIGVSRVHLHHFMFVEDSLRQLATDLKAEFYFTIHDYYCINGNPTLTDKQGVFCGDLASAERDNLCLKSRPLAEGETAAQWRQQFSALLAKADCIIAPSVDCKDRFNRDFEQLQIVVAQHEDSYRPADTLLPVSAPKKGLKVLTLGALSPEKGADVIEACAKRLVAEKNDISIELLGYAYRELDSSIHTHGHYRSDELQQRLAQIQPDIIWLPAQWPETYSYTLSAALEYGCKIVISDIGAPLERLAGRDHTWAMPWQSDAQAWADFFTRLHTGEIEHYNAYATKDLAKPSYITDFYLANYLQLEQRAPTTDTLPVLTPFARNIPADKQLSSKEQLLVLLYKVYTHKYFRVIAKIIPVHILRKIKRALSNQPIDRLT